MCQSQGQRIKKTHALKQVDLSTNKVVEAQVRRGVDAEKKGKKRERQRDHLPANSVPKYPQQPGLWQT